MHREGVSGVFAGSMTGVFDFDEVSAAYHPSANNFDVLILEE